MKKVFVSHSSYDKEIVDIFIDKILKLGFNLTPDDIAYTSREDTGVKTGEDIKTFIKENISTCDFVFFMISDNYAKSQICLNEMGAAWAKEREVIPIVFPNIGFESIGWLYSVNKGINLTDPFGLDSIFEKVNAKYGHKLSISAWNRYKGEFIYAIENKSNLPAITERTETDDALDLLDYRETFDENITENIGSSGRIIIALEQYEDEITSITKHLNNINNANKNTYFPPSGQIRTIMQKAARDTNRLSDILDNEVSVIKDTFDKITACGIKMREMAPLYDDNTIKEEEETVSMLIESFQNALSATKEFKAAVEDEDSNLDKTYNKSKKRLVGCLEKMIAVLEFNIDKSYELLIHTA